MVIEYFLDWIENASVSKRVDAATALTKAWKRNDLAIDERDDVEAAITTLLDDPSPEVRITLAEGFDSWPDAPRHVISALAADNLEIAITVLSRSPVFLDAELVRYVEEGSMEHQIAIACRPWLSSQVVLKTCETGCEEACLGLLANPVAKLSPDNCHAIALRFGTVTDIRVILLERPDLETETRLLLINKLGEALNSLVSERSWMSPPRADAVINDACDKASIAFAANAPDCDVDRVVASLVKQERMTASYLLRAVCMGNITLVARALSYLSGIECSRVESVLTRDRRAAFKAVYDRAGLPETAFAVFHCAISTWRRLLSSNSAINQSRLPFLVTKEVLETYAGNKDHVVDELLVLLRKLSAEAARESAKSKADEISNRSKLRQQQLLLSSETVGEKVDDTDGIECVEDIIEIDESYINAFADNLQQELEEMNFVDTVEAEILPVDEEKPGKWLSLFALPASKAA